MVVAMAGMRIHTSAATVHQGGHTLEVFSSKRDYDGVAIWGSGWWLVLTHNIGLFNHHILY